MGLIESLDSLLMVHPWQHDQGFGFGVYLNIILERSTTRVQEWVRLYSLILCWWCIHGSMMMAMALVCTSTWSWNDQPHTYNASGWIPWFSVDGESIAACSRLWLWCVLQYDLETINHTHTMGPVVFPDSLLMMHPLLASMFSVDLNMILEWSTLTNLLILLLSWQIVYWRLWEWTATLEVLIVLMVMNKYLLLMNTLRLLSRIQSSKTT